MSFIIKNVRLSFPNLFHPVEFKPGDDKPRWDASFLIEPGSENDKLIQKAIKEEATATWGEKAEAELKKMRGQGNKYCYIDGNTKEYSGYEDRWCLSTHRSAKGKGGTPNTPPVVIGRDKAPITAESGKIYAGCFVNAKVSIYCQKGDNPGVRASFSVVQFASDGDAFSSDDRGTDDFESLETGSDADGFDAMV